MISSMTAYARCEKNSDNVKVAVEARTYNSRHLDIALKMPSDFAELEDKIKKKIGSNIFRGRVEMRLYIEDSSQSDAEFYIDYEKARSYYAIYSKLKEELGLNEGVGIEQILKSEGVMKKNDKKDCTIYLPFINEAMDDILKDLKIMRNKEGDSLKKDFIDRLNFVSDVVEKIEKESVELVSIYKDKLKVRIKDLVSKDVEIDETRLAQEVAFIADKSDISEEIVRAKSHLKQFLEYIDSKEPAGRKLNFLLQELHREINTMGVKSGSSSVARDCVEVKSELEKLREQVQNVE